MQERLDHESLYSFSNDFFAIRFLKIHACTGSATQRRTTRKIFDDGIEMTGQISGSLDTVKWHRP